MNDHRWNLRVRASGQGKATAYVRQHRIEIGVPLQFDPEYGEITALEYLLAALGADLVNGLRAVARRGRVPLDEVEALVSGRLNNPLTSLGVVGEEGHPGIEQISVRVYVSTDADEERLQSIWEEMLRRSPLLRTLQPAVQLDISLTIVG